MIAPLARLVATTATPAAGARAVRLHDPEVVLPAPAATTMIDDWPRQIEVLTLLPQRKRAFVTLGSIDPGARTATASAGIIDDAGETIVAGRFLQGPCTLEIAPNLDAAFHALGTQRR